MAASGGPGYPPAPARLDQRYGCTSKAHVHRLFEPLQQALARYRDDFLTGFSLSDAPVVGRAFEHVQLVNAYHTLGDQEKGLRSALTHLQALSLTFDHRLVDGALAAAFLQEIKRFLEAPEPLLS